MTIRTTTLARDESGDRARLGIQYQSYRYPEEFTEDAPVYIERTNMIMSVDAFSLGVLAEPPPERSRYQGASCRPPEPIDGVLLTLAR